MFNVNDEVLIKNPRNYFSDGRIPKEYIKHGNEPLLNIIGKIVWSCENYSAVEYSVQNHVMCMGFNNYDLELFIVVSVEFDIFN